MFILQGDLISDIIGAFTGSYSAITTFIQMYSYGAVFLLMLLEGSTLPVPSEVVIPAAGYFAAKGFMNIYLAYAAVLLGSIGGLIVDYTIGYVLGKEVVYKHLAWFKISREKLDRFDRWFNENGKFAIFASRLVPVVRTAMSFPAGFAKMPLKTFFFYSIAGTMIWDAALILLGYWLLSSQDVITVSTALAGFALVMLILYYRFVNHPPKSGKR